MNGVIFFYCRIFVIFGKVMRLRGETQWQIYIDGTNTTEVWVGVLGICNGVQNTDIKYSTSWNIRIFAKSC